MDLPDQLDSNARVGVRKGTGTTYARRRVSLIEGTNVSFTVADDPTNEEVDVTVNVQAYVPGSQVVYHGATAPTDTYADGRLVLLPQDGAAVSRTTYAALFARIGTAYGVGDGSTTFNVPNHEDRLTVGAGNLYAVGDTGGAAEVTLTTAEMPSHTHTQDAHTHTQDAHNHGDNDSNSDGFMLHATASSTYGAAAGIDIPMRKTTTTASTPATNQNATATNQNTGGGGAHENMPPYIAAIVCIAT